MAKNQDNKPAILDSSVWVAYLDKKDSQHEKARKIFANLSSKVYMPEYVLLEVATVLTQNVSKKKSNRFIEIALHNEDVIFRRLSGEEFKGLIGFYLELENNKLSFVDSALLYLSRHHEVITFDEGLNKLL